MCLLWILKLFQVFGLAANGGKLGYCIRALAPLAQGLVT